MSRKDKRKQKQRGRQPLADTTSATLNVGDKLDLKNRSRSRQGRKGKNQKKEKKPNVGLLVTEELSKAIETTKATVERIVKECRARNKRFRCSPLRAYHLDVEADDHPGTPSLIWNTTSLDACMATLSTRMLKGETFSASLRSSRTRSSSPRVALLKQATSSKAASGRATSSLPYLRSPGSLASLKRYALLYVPLSRV